MLVHTRGDDLRGELSQAGPGDVDPEAVDLLGIVRSTLLSSEMLRYPVTKPLRGIFPDKQDIASKERSGYGEKENIANHRRCLTDINALAIGKSDRRRLLNL